jgi:integrase/recombinase XerD
LIIKKKHGYIGSAKIRDMETIHLYIMVHKAEERIAVGIAYSVTINKAIKNIDGIKWSKTKKLWHLPVTNQSVREIVRRTQGIAFVNIDMLNEWLEKQKTGLAEQVSKTEPVINPVREIKLLEEADKATRLSAENTEALRLYMQMLTLKAYSINTIKTYRNEFTQFLIKLAHINANKLNAVHIKRYMEYCANEEKIAENTLHSRLNAIKFYYEKVLEQDKILWEIPRAKKPFLLPKVLNEAELKRMFASVRNLKHKAILFTAYSAGLRVSEVVKLRVSDIDSERMQIFVERAKGKKDRVVNLSILLLDILRQYMKLQKPRPITYLFANDKEDGPYSIRSAQVIFQRAKNMAGIKKDIGFHSLRHSFATHLLEKGVDVKYIKDILGHFDIRTTERYLHISKEKLINIISPLDTLYDFEPDHLRIDATDNSPKKH